MKFLDSLPSWHKHYIFPAIFTIVGLALGIIVGVPAFQAKASTLQERTLQDVSKNIEDIENIEKRTSSLETNYAVINVKLSNIETSICDIKAILEASSQPKKK